MSERLCSYCGKPVTGKGLVRQHRMTNISANFCSEKCWKDHKDYYRQYVAFIDTDMPKRYGGQIVGEDRRRVLAR